MKNHLTITIIFTFFLGWFFIFLSSQLINFQFFENTLLSIGTSLIASSLFLLIHSIYISSENKATAMVKEWGIINIYQTRAEMNLSCNKYLENNKHSLDIIAFGLKSFREAQENLIKEKLKNGMKIRILTMDKNSDFLKERSVEENEIPDQIKETIINLEKWINDLKKEARNDDQIKIKFYNKLPFDFYFKLDKVLFTGPYQYNKSSQQTISYEFDYGGSGYKYYSDYFESLWNNPNLLK